MGRGAGRGRGMNLQGLKTMRGRGGKWENYIKLCYLYSNNFQHHFNQI